MTTVTLRGTPVHTVGSLPPVGTQAPDFRLTRGDLSDVSLKDFAGRKVVLNITPSLDTGVCAATARRFDKEATDLQDTVVLHVTNDLPFAQARFCQAEGLTNVTTLSQLRDRDFGRAWGVEILDGPMAGLLSRALVVLDRDGKVAYAQQVPEIAQEPDYGPALKAVRALL